MTAPAPLRIGTRRSHLALAQARRVANLVEQRLDRRGEIVPMATRGDIDATWLEGGVPVGVFTREIQLALLDGRIDIAVHSLKDLPIEEPPGLAVVAIPERADPRDALVGPVPLEALRPGARIGTSSPRRRALIAAARPDLAIEEIHGTVPTRIQKVRLGLCDAVVLAAAGLDRLGLDLGPGLGRFDLPLDPFIPAPAQGALAVEARAEDAGRYDALHDPDVAACVEAERALLRLLGGGCGMPLGAHAVRVGGAGEGTEGRIRLAAVLGARRAVATGRSPLEAAVRAKEMLG